MAIISFKSSSTTLLLNGEVIDNFINGDILELAPVNPETARTYGSSGAVNIQQRSDREVYTLKFRLMKNSDSDIFMNKQLNHTIPVIFYGSIKEVYVKNGIDGVDNFEIQAGSITDKPSHTRNNQDGDATVEYTIECFAKRLV